MPSDPSLNYYLASGTAAERAAFTPSPPTPAAGPDSGYLFYETDTGALYAWDGSAWDLISAGGGGSLLSVLTADPGSPANDTAWIVREGTTPTEVSLKVRIAGTTHVLAGLTLP